MSIACVTAVNYLPVLHYCVYAFFRRFMQKGVDGVTCFIIIDEQLHWNRGRFFLTCKALHFLGISLKSEWKKHVHFLKSTKNDIVFLLQS